MLNILESTKYVVDNSCFVKINSNNFNNIVSKVDKNSFGLEIREIEDIFKHLNKEQILAYNVVYNTINFCYWGDPK
jgi:2,4-dienoyl-CoA reductase-like NADH-dependent reductase (Old Yellow Enzyme family)